PCRVRARKHHRRGEPDRVRLGHRRGPDRDLDRADRRLRLELLPGEAGMTSATVTAARASTVTRRRRVQLPRIGLHIFLIVTAVLWLTPVIWAVFTSLRPYSDTQQYGYVSIPHKINLSNYENAGTQA